MLSALCDAMPFIARAPHLYMQMVLQQPTVRVPTWIDQKPRQAKDKLQMHLQMGPFSTASGEWPQSHHEDDRCLGSTTSALPQMPSAALMNWEATQAERKENANICRSLDSQRVPALSHQIWLLIGKDPWTQKRAGEPQTQGHKVTHLHYTKWAEK